MYLAIWKGEKRVSGALGGVDGEGELDGAGKEYSRGEKKESWGVEDFDGGWREEEEEK